MEPNLIAILFIVAFYMATMIAIGIVFSKRNKSTDDFYLGGRKLGPLVTAMSAEASDMSAYLLMGIPGLALASAVLGSSTGFAEVLWTCIGLAAGTYLNWLIVAKRLRRYSEKLNANTVPDFFANRYGDKAVLTVISAVIIIVFFVPYTASGFSAVGKLFNSLFGIDYHIAMVVGAVVISAYTVIGGFLAASFTDLIQSIVMTIALLVVVGFCVSSAGGVGEAVEVAGSVENYFSITGTDGSFDIFHIVSTLAWGLGYFGMPHILLRFMAIKSDKKIATSRRIASVWVVISMAIAIVIGIVGAGIIKSNAFDTKVGFDSERVIIYIANVMSRTAPVLAVVAGIIISGILASTMSTADSQMLAAASSVSENICKKLFFKNMSNKTQMWLARGTVLGIAVIGVIFAWNPESSVFRIVSFAWAGFGAAFGPLMLVSLFWKRANKYGAVAGVISGGAMVFIWKFFISKLGGIFEIYELLPAFIVSLAVIIVVSLLTKKPDDEIVKTFEEVRNCK